MMKIKRITEVGVAVRDLEAATKLFVDLLGAEAGEVVTVDLYKMRYRMCRVGKVDFELMEPIGDEDIGRREVYLLAPEVDRGDLARVYRVSG
jgi:catechol 2,3-dioxygenase-like lactoylglutathione lyase family enzyme